MAFGIDRSAAAILLLLLFTGAGFASFTYVRSYNNSDNSTINTFYNITTPISAAYAGGILYVGDDQLTGIVFLNQSDAAIGNVGVSGPNSAEVQRPVKIIANGGTLYIADPYLGEVKKYDIGNKTINAAGPSPRERKRPMGVAVDGDQLFVIDGNTDQITIYQMGNRVINTTILGRGFGSDGITDASDIALDGGHIYVSDTGNDRIAVFDRAGKFVDSWGRGRGGVELFHPNGIEIYNNRLYVADALNKRIVVFGMDGYPIETLPNYIADGGNRTFATPVDIAVADGSLFVVDTDNKKVVQFSIAGDSGSPQIWAKIIALNASIKEVESVRKLLTDAGGQAGAWEGPSRLASAVAKYGAGEYGGALETANSAADLVKMENLTAMQAVRLVLQQRLDAVNGQLAAYPNTTMPSELAAVKKNIVARADDAQSKINNADYAGALSAIASVEKDAAALDAKFKGIAEEKAKPPPTPKPAVDNGKDDMLSLSGALSEKLSALRDDQSKFGVQKDYGGIQALIDSGVSLAKLGDTAQANASLSAAASAIVNEEQSWQQIRDSVRNATAEIQNARRYLDENKAWNALSGDSSKAAQELDEAQKLVSTDPVRAGILARQAMASAQMEAEKGKSRGLAAGTLATAMIGILFMAAAAYWLYRNRKHRGI